MSELPERERVRIRRDNLARQRDGDSLDGVGLCEAEVDGAGDGLPLEVRRQVARRRRIRQDLERRPGRVARVEERVRVRDGPATRCALCRRCGGVSVCARCDREAARVAIEQGGCARVVGVAVIDPFGEQGAVGGIVHCPVG